MYKVRDRFLYRERHALRSNNTTSPEIERIIN